MNLVAEPIERYCWEHSSRPSPLGEELAAYTRENVPYPQMLCGPLVGGLLGFLVGMLGARRVLEVGCYTGYSALAMAERMPEGAELVTLDVNPETTAIAERFWSRSPHGRKIRPILAPALETLARLEGPFDFAFIDADKGNYLNYLKAVLPLLSPRGAVVADNCLWRGEVLPGGAADADTQALRRFNEAVHGDPALESVLLPVRDGLHLIRKRAP